jgi:hypothetical protein
MSSSFMRFLAHTQRRTTVGRTPLDGWSARRRDLYLTTHNTHNRQTSISPVGFELATPASKRPQTYALDRAGNDWLYNVIKTGPVPLFALDCWNRGFESRWGHGCSSLVLVVCYVVGGLCDGADHSSRGFLPAVCACVWSGNLNNETAYAWVGL